MNRKLRTMSYEDILFEIQDGVARITINRPSVMNAFRGRTCEELIDAFNRAGWDKSVGVIVLAGSGDKAFCTGGDQSAHEGQYDGRGMIGLPVEELHSLIRDVPKPARAYKVMRSVAVTCLPLSAISQLLRNGRYSARSVQRWARSMPASAQHILHE